MSFIFDEILVFRGIFTLFIVILVEGLGVVLFKFVKKEILRDMNCERGF